MRDLIAFLLWLAGLGVFIYGLVKLADWLYTEHHEIWVLAVPLVIGLALIDSARLISK